MSKGSSKKSGLFKKIFFSYLIVLGILLISLVFYVILALMNYEKYDIGNFIKYSVSNLSNKDLVDIIDTQKLAVSKYDLVSTRKEIIKVIDNLLDDEKHITYKLNAESNDPKKPIYDVFYKDQLIFTLKLSNKGNVSKLRLINYAKWEVVNIKSHIEEGLYSVKATLPENYKLFINDKEVKETTYTENSNTILFSNYTDIKKDKSYDVPGLVKKPKIAVKDENGNKVETKEVDGVLVLKDEFFKTDDNEQAQSKLISPINILDFAEKYSMFMTNDLKGYRHGFNILSTYLIEGTDLYNNSYSWAYGTEINGVLRHTLKNPAFTDEKLSNFVVYSDKAFSVNVSLKKNMVLNGSDKIDEENSKMLFVYYNDMWKLLSIEKL